MITLVLPPPRSLETESDGSACAQLTGDKMMMDLFPTNLLEAELPQIFCPDDQTVGYQYIISRKDY